MKLLADCINTMEENKKLMVLIDEIYDDIGISNNVHTRHILGTYAEKPFEVQLTEHYVGMEYGEFNAEEREFIHDYCWDNFS